MKTETSNIQPTAVPSVDEIARTKGLPVAWERLASLAFFDGFDEHELKQIAAYTKLSYFAPDDTILEQGDLANRFYILLSGQASVECQVNGKQLQIEELGPGDAVGFSWLFTPEKLHFTVRVTDPVVAIFFYGTLLREDCEIDPRLGYHLLQRASRLMLRRLENVITLLAHSTAPVKHSEESW